MFQSFYLYVLQEHSKYNLCRYEKMKNFKILLNSK